MAFDLENIPSQQGKVAIVTGANTGLGYETVSYLAQKHFKVIMACRDLEKAAQAKAKIKMTVPVADLEILQIDLSDLSSVRGFAQIFRQNYNSLDLLINNAGIMWPPYALTVDGFESQMGANYFGHFLLTALLLDLMPNTSESRVVSLSSNAHRLGAGKINFDDLQSKQNYSKTGAYAQSKLACLMFGNELQRRLAQAGKKILSVTAHPGVSNTELARHMPQYQVQLIQYTIGPWLCHAPDQAALPIVMAALDPEAQGGEYFGPQGFMEMKGQPGRATQSNYAQNLAAAAQLWDVSEELTGCTFAIPQVQAVTTS
ncbi:oxidoreductase [Acaryochloris sp. CCMEE 5410]|uniref:oxidoreductase n=1 Tax=Acaryochloris sp. CCMEE 5410 TaxID=310037 RepID=UPI00024852A5|nr:oxidoreductase [Acaryochloris sp. CCMEE 5410]KAI9135179.1 SDR family NAD(P)-dependent oxidoreductase [Acaryochloris sp. CCMEE 5410]